MSCFGQLTNLKLSVRQASYYSPLVELHVHQEGPTPNECQKVRTEDRGGKEVVFWVGLGKDHAHEGSEGSKHGMPKRAAKSPPILTQLNHNAECFYASGKLLHITTKFETEINSGLQTV